MQILLYEYFTGGGLTTDGANNRPHDSLFEEGRAMVGALAEDLSAIPGLDLIRFEDARIADGIHAPGQVVSITDAIQESQQLNHWAPRVDASILIAPETDNKLSDRCRQVERSGGRLLSPDAEFVDLATDKHRTAKRLNAAGVATPHAEVIPADTALPRQFPYPGVLKPNDGAGAGGTQLIPSSTSGSTIGRRGVPMRLEQFCPGAAVSVSALCGNGVSALCGNGVSALCGNGVSALCGNGVSALCGNGRSVLLPGCRQRISQDGQFRYLGGELPLTGAEAERANTLARRTLSALPDTRGYVGIDMILGSAPSGDDDVVLEVNPRLTTSYVGLRHLAKTNLAAAMLAIAGGEPHPLCFRTAPVEFDADGRVVYK